MSRYLSNIHTRILQHYFMICLFIQLSINTLHQLEYFQNIPEPTKYSTVEIVTQVLFLSSISDLCHPERHMFMPIPNYFFSTAI